MLLFTQAHFGDFVATFVQRLLDAMTILFEPTQFGILFLQYLACFDELLVDEQALTEITLPLVLQTRDRIAAGHELRRDLGTARVELHELALHALQGLLERRQRCAP